MPRARRNLVIVVLVVVVPVAAAAFGFWWFVLRDDAPPEASLRERPAETAAPTSTAPDASPNGTWTVQADDPTQVFVGYRVEELFAGETIKNTAAGRTPAVSGTLVVAEGRVTEVTVTADMRQLRSDRDRRDGALRTRGLETDTFPEATFVLTEPTALEPALEPGANATVTARGDLTIHGVTRPVEITLDARWNGDTIDVAGSLPIVMGDYGIDPPHTPIITVDDHGTMELQLTFART